MLVKTVLENKSFYSLKLSDFSMDVIPNSVAEIAQKISTHACAISLPINVNNKPIGAILFSKNYVDDFSNEMDILTAFTTHIAVAIDNAKTYENLRIEINKLKDNR